MWSYDHGDFTVHQIPALADNYIYLIQSGDALAAVDPAEARPVIAACDALGATLTHVLNTHHHWDHTGGNLDLKKVYDCTIVGAAHDAARIPGIDLRVAEGELLQLGDQDVAILDIPGHTNGHIAYVTGEGEHTALFCGDTLFSAGCGRLFEGSPEQMWHSLQKLLDLPEKTRFYCAHEYTLNNLEFCLQKVSRSDAVHDYHAWVTQQRAQGMPSIPGRLDTERQINPMLLPADPGFCASYAAQHGIADDALGVFTHIRAARNHW